MLEENATFGIVYGECDESKFVVHELVSLPQVFIVHKDHPLGKFEEIELNQLKDCPLILPSIKSRPGAVLRNMFEEESIKPNIVFECERPLQIIEMICNNPNLVARILANDLLSVDFANIKPLKLKGKPFTLPICLIYKRSRQLNCLENLFKHTVLGCFSK
ncbi:hypothetical protein SDC9_184861 [bioreactor metagenome]|uniref:LysR substrate-binding domain-containing protein n=1 Tax=bioreactor metagenome TaxID=1076179 RepID=A0A645HMK3_9ZZZZ